MGIQVKEIPEIEADDIVGTLAKEASNKGYKVDKKTKMLRKFEKGIDK